LLDPIAQTEPAAPPRLSEAEVAQQGAEVAGNATLLAVLEAFPGPAAVLNDRRQILAANREFHEATVDFRPGLRPGEALGCVEVARGRDGCGTGEACTRCGAGRSLLRLEQGEAGPLREECVITCHGAQGEEQHEFDAGISRLPGGWTMLAMRDISGEKRRRVLERCFLHDALNAAGGVQGLAQLAADGQRGMGAILPVAATALVEELRHHQTLLAAEAGELIPDLQRIRLDEICSEVATLYARHPISDRRRVVVRVAALWVISDRVLLRRVLANLVKNALEATRVGAVIEISAQSQQGRVALTVGNPGEMSIEAQQQIFRRYFSTKAATGRGIGTWSVKLLVERYLGGSVAYSSGADRTTFTVELPAA
jgi:hypothetical protein